MIRAISMATNTRSFLVSIGQQAGDPGRAKKYDEEFHCAKVRELAQKGDFPEAWAAEIGVTFNTMRLWVSTYPEFKEAVFIARILLQTYWTRQLTQARDKENTKPGIYSLILRRFPELYGNNPADLWAFLHSPPGMSGIEAMIQGNKDAPLTNDSVRTMTDADISARLEILRRRRAAESEE